MTAAAIAAAAVTAATAATTAPSTTAAVATLASSAVKGELLNHALAVALRVKDKWLPRNVLVDHG